MKKIIVTGGSGFIGSNLVNFLLKRNFFVINIDKLTYSSNKSNIKNKKNYRFFKTDINNRKEIFSIIKKYKPSAIFNLAAETHVDRSIDNPKEFILSNILGVFNILEILRILKKRKKEIKLIHISTDEVFGDILNKKERSDENYPYKPSSPYSATKASADHLIKSYVRTYNLKAIISNCSNNYGPFQFPEKLIPLTIINCLQKMIDSNKEEAKISAIHCMANLKTNIEIVKILEKCSLPGSDKVRSEAIRALGSHNCEETIKLLRYLQNDMSIEICELAHAALNKVEHSSISGIQIREQVSIPVQKDS